MKLFDAFGREVKTQSKPDERVVSVASLFDNEPGFQSQGLTPVRLATILRAAAQGDPYRQMELFEELEEKDCHLLSVLGKRRGMVSGLDYKIEPASQDQRDQDVADFVLEVIEGLEDFEDNLKDVTDAIGKGYAALELVWGVEKNRNVVRQMIRIDQKRFTWRKLSEPPHLLTDEDAFNGIELTPFKFLFHTHKIKSGHPTRQGVLRVVAWMYLFKNFGVKDWVKFAETFGMPLRLGKYQSGATKDEKAALLAAVRAIGSDAAGIISERTAIEFIETAAKGTSDLHKTLADFCNAEMSKAVLGQTLTTEQGDKGARSLGDVHKDVQDDLNADDCEQIAKTFRRDLIRPLVGFNFGWDVPLPWLHFEYEDEEDLTAEAARYKTHLESGVKIPVDHYYEKFRIPKPEEGEEVIEFPRQAAPPQQDQLGQPQQQEQSASRRHNPRHELYAAARSDDEDNLEGFLDRLLREAGQDDLIDPVFALLENANSLEEFRDGLIDLHPNIRAEEMGAVIQMAMTASDLLGRFESLPDDVKEDA